ncbi:hypothetical protein LCGC14_2044050, partial [marine sediment metagenome]
LGKVTRLSDKILARAGVIFGVILLALTLLFAGGWVADRVLELLDRLANQVVFKIPPEQETEREEFVRDGEPLVASSFTDLFSGDGWLNKNSTTLYQNRVTTVFTFPPEFEWQKIESTELPYGIDRFVERREDGSDARCLNNSCLVQKELNLSLDAYNVALPKSVRVESLVDVSIGALDTVWLIGTVEQKDNTFIGRAFYFNGRQFEEIFEEDAPFRSKYEGKIGFGGSDENFLVVYGAYEGMAYHIRKGKEPVDISRFFGIRVMRRGFQPVVVKSGSGEDTAWYVFSMTENNPKFIKLFQNGTDEIVGVFDLTKSLFITPVKSASFYLNKNVNTLNAKIMTLSSEEEFWEFTDKGFDKSETFEIVSVNINNYSAEVRRAAISGHDFSDRGTRVEFYLSNNGEDWFQVELGEMFEFPQKDGRQLLWRAEFIPNGGPHTSPFLDSIRLDYWVRFL